MNYKDYQNSRDMVWKLMIDMNISELPIPIVNLCNEIGIKVRYDTLKPGNDGECCFIDGIPYIFINHNTTPERRRFTVAHELGHLVLGHVGKFELVNREISDLDNPIEQAANVFASRLLAPACVLWGCGITNSEQIMKLCNISKTAAEYRMKRMNILYKRDKFLTSELEKVVFNQFQKFIQLNKF